MMFQKLILRTLIGLFLIGSLAQCGKKTKSQDVKISIAPTEPIVITGDGVDGSGNAIKAPWFNFKLVLTNDSDDDLTIVGVKVDVSGINQDGTVSNDTKTFLPTDANYSTSTTSCTYSSTYDVIHPDHTAHTLTVTLTNGGGDCKTQVPASFYKDSNPANSNFHYRFQVTPLGWFGTSSQQDARFDNFAYFHTQ